MCLIENQVLNDWQYDLCPLNDKYPTDIFIFVSFTSEKTRCWSNGIELLRFHLFSSWRKQVTFIKGNVYVIGFVNGIAVWMCKYISIYWDKLFIIVLRKRMRSIRIRVSYCKINCTLWHAVMTYEQRLRIYWWRSQVCNEDFRTWTKYIWTILFLFLHSSFELLYSLFAFEISDIWNKNTRFFLTL